MVPQFLHQLARKAIGKHGFVEAMARTLLYNLKGTSYGQSVGMIYRSKRKRRTAKISSWKDSSTLEDAVNHNAFPNWCTDLKLFIYLQIFLYQRFHRNNMLFFDHDGMQRNTQHTGKTKFYGVWWKQKMHVHATYKKRTRASFCNFCNFFFYSFQQLPKYSLCSSKFCDVSSSFILQLSIFTCNFLLQFWWSIAQKTLQNYLR